MSWKGTDPHREHVSLQEQNGSQKSNRQKWQRKHKILKVIQLRMIVCSPLMILQKGWGCLEFHDPHIHEGCGITKLLETQKMLLSYIMGNVGCSVFGAWDSKSVYLKLRWFDFDHSFLKSVSCKSPQLYGSVIINVCSAEKELQTFTKTSSQASLAGLSPKLTWVWIFRPCHVSESDWYYQVAEVPNPGHVMKTEPTPSQLSKVRAVRFGWKRWKTLVSGHEVKKQLNTLFHLEQPRHTATTI